jgi:hypothetical protein
MPKSRQDLDLALKSMTDRCGLRIFLMQDLNDDQAVAIQFARKISPAHTALAQKADRTITIQENTAPHGCASRLETEEPPMHASLERNQRSWAGCSDGLKGSKKVGVASPTSQRGK